MDLKERLSKVPDYQNYEPMFGWNDKTGEPWLAIHVAASNAYPAVSGTENERLQKLMHLTGHKFTFQYLRCSGYLLLWPEFRRESRSPDDWRKMSELRGFLTWWARSANSTNILRNIEDAYEVYQRRQLHKPLPLPDGFPRDRLSSDKRSRPEAPRPHSPERAPIPGSRSLESRITHQTENPSGARKANSSLVNLQPYHLET
jgi:hypothetical protein